MALLCLLGARVSGFELLRNVSRAVDVLLTSSNVLVLVELLFLLRDVNSGNNSLSARDGNLNIECLLDGAGLIDDLGDLNGLLLGVRGGNLDSDLLINHDGVRGRNLLLDLSARWHVGGLGGGATAARGRASAASLSGTAATLGLEALALVLDRDNDDLLHGGALGDDLDLSARPVLGDLDGPLNGVGGGHGCLNDLVDHDGLLEVLLNGPPLDLGDHLLPFNDFLLFFPLRLSLVGMLVGHWELGLGHGLLRSVAAAAGLSSARAAAVARLVEEGQQAAGLVSTV